MELCTSYAGQYGAETPRLRSSEMFANPPPLASVYLHTYLAGRPFCVLKVQVYTHPSIHPSIPANHGVLYILYIPPIELLLLGLVVI